MGSGRPRYRTTSTSIFWTTSSMCSATKTAMKTVPTRNGLFTGKWISYHVLCDAVRDPVHARARTRHRIVEEEHAR